MPRNGHKKNIETRDQQLCDLELRQTKAEMALEQMELRRRTLETTLLRFKKLYENSPIGFITFDDAGRIVDLNQAAVRLLQVTPNGMLGLAVSVLIADRSCAAFTEHLRKSRRGEGESISTDVEMITGDGGKIPVQMVTTIVPLDSGRLFETALIDLTAQKAAAAEVARAREYSEAIVSTIPYPVLVVDSRGCVVGANAAFYYAFQTNEGQVVNWPISQLPDIAWQMPTFQNLLLQTLKDGRHLEALTLRAEVRGASLLTFNVNARRLISRDGIGREQLLVVAFEDITKRQRAEAERELLLTELQESQFRLETRVKERTQELGKSYSRLRALGEQLVLAHESEQRRIARELHDQIGQDLTALKITLSRGKGAKLEQTQQVLQEAHALTDEILQTVRNICGTLRPQVLDDLGLVVGLQWHIKTFSARTNLDITFDFAPIDESQLTPMVKSTIFRVVQEALTNVSRHADTKSASVMIAMRKSLIEFSVRDGGKGFDPAAVATQSNGLSGMRERIGLVAGKFEISSSPGAGTIIRARIPLSQPTVTDQPNRTTHHGKRTKDQSNHSRRPSPGPQRAQIAPL